MSKPEPVTVICRYTVKPGKEGEMKALLRRHWDTLHKVGLVTDDAPLFFEGVPAHPETEKNHGASSGVFVEIFSWKTPDSSRVAHDTPAVMAVWEPMGALCDAMDFPHFKRFDARA